MAIGFLCMGGESMSEAIIASKTPFAVSVEAGKTYAWCACGRSQAQPMCDGSHRDTGIKPVLYKATQSETLYFCGCKQTKTSPFCDGSHNQL